MYKKYIGFVVLIALFLTILAFVVYSFNYCIAWDGDIKHDVTLSFVGVLSLIVSPSVTLISVILYYSSLEEQRKQNELVMEQQFYAKWQNLLNNHLKIRDEQRINYDVIKNNKEFKILLSGHICFVALWKRYLRLIEALKRNTDYWKLDEIIMSWENYEEKMEMDWKAMEYCTLREYEKEMKNIEETKHIDYVAYLFKVTKDMNNGNSSKKAFELLYDRYLSRSSIYLTHFCSLLKFLERNENIYGDKMNECVDLLMAILTESEKSIILLYADYNTKNGELIKKYIKS